MSYFLLLLSFLFAIKNSKNIEKNYKKKKKTIKKALMNLSFCTMCSYICKKVDFSIFLFKREKIILDNAYTYFILYISLFNKFTFEN